MSDEKNPKPNPNDVTVGISGTDLQYNGLPSGSTPPVQVREVTGWLVEKRKAARKEQEKTCREEWARELERCAHE